jgi:hypothetical protein
MLAAHPREEEQMKRVLATLVALSLIMSMFTGVFAPVPEARAYPNPAPVNLLSAGNYVILAKTGVSTVPYSIVNGNVGVSPVGRGSLTGWSLITEPTDTYFTSAQVVAPGKLYAADQVGGTTSTDLGTAVLNMQAAYTDAASRSSNLTGLGAGTVAYQTLVPGVYTWGSNVTITTDLILDAQGNANAVWIFQISGTLNMAAAKNVILSGGALPQNIFWQVAGAVTLGTTSHFEGIILAQTNIVLQTGATLSGRALAQSAVTLDNGRIWDPTSAERPGTITVIKDTVPDGPQDFSFTIAGGLYVSTTFSLDDDADPTLSNTQVFSDLLPGTYTIAEAPVVGYTLTGVSGATSFDLSTRMATVTLAIGATTAATVIFTNNGVPDIRLRKSVSPVGTVLPGTRLTYTLTYTNTGTGNSSPDTIITDVLDKWLDAATLHIFNMVGSYDSTTRTITWNVGEVPPGTTVTVSFYANVRSTIDVPLLIHNTGRYSGRDGSGASNTVTTLVQPPTPPEEPPQEPVIPPPPPSIVINVVAPEPLCVEAYLPYQICFTNGVPPYKYTVDFGDGTPIVTGTTSSSCVTLEHAYLEIRQYSFYVTVGDSNGLESTSRQTFIPKDCTTKVVVYHHNFFIGYPDGTFQPDGNITRAEMAAAMSRALGLGWTTDPSGFSDLKATHWAAGHITLMKQEGFMMGDPAGTFRPDDPMTRAEAAAAFLRIAGMSPVLNPSSSSFKDVQPMSWAAGYIEAARTAGLLAGYPDNTFRPADLLSRAEFATLACNALGRVLTSTNSRENAQYVVKFPDVTPDFWAYNYILEVSTPHTVTNPTRLTRSITLKDRKIPLFSEGDNGIITFLHVGDTITAIVPVDGLQPDGSDPAPRTVKVRIINHERP